MRNVQYAIIKNSTLERGQLLFASGPYGSTHNVRFFDKLPKAQYQLEQRVDKQDWSIYEIDMDKLKASFSKIYSEAEVLQQIKGIL